MSGFEPELSYAQGKIVEISSNGLLIIEVSESVETYKNFTSIGVDILEVKLFRVDQATDQLTEQPLTYETSSFQSNELKI